MTSFNPDGNAVVIPNGPHFARLDYAAEQWMPEHAHSDAVSLVFTLAGIVEERRERQNFTLEPQTLTLIPKDLPHANRFHKDHSALVVVVREPWLSRLTQFPICLNNPAHFRNCAVTAIAARMHREFQRRDALTPLALEGMLLELLAEMARDALDFDRRAVPLWLQQAREHLHERFTESVSLLALANAVGVHPSHLARAFRQRFRCTVGDYTRRLRIERACQLLAGSQDSLTQIAFAVGFADQSHFSHSFKKQMGVSPAAYRKNAGRAILKQSLRP